MKYFIEIFGLNSKRQNYTDCLVPGKQYNIQSAALSQQIFRRRWTKHP